MPVAADAGMLTAADAGVFHLHHTPAQDVLQVENTCNSDRKTPTMARSENKLNQLKHSQNDSVYTIH